MGGVFGGGDDRPAPPLEERVKEPPTTIGREGIVIDPPEVVALREKNKAEEDRLGQLRNPTAEDLASSRGRARASAATNLGLGRRRASELLTDYASALGA